MVRLTMKQSIVIYQDEGVGEFSLQCLLHYFEGHGVTLANATSVMDGNIFHGKDVFVMPGGADLPYCKKLNGKGNQNIRAFVENGGTYLGICAGAYYGCRAIEFHKGRSDEILGERELAFTDAVAYGSLSEIAPPYDDTLKTAAITQLLLSDGRAIHAYYHGGCAFRIGKDSSKVLARYAMLDSQPPAVISNQVGHGRVILSGVHLETSAYDVARHPAPSAPEEQRRQDLFKAAQSKLQDANTVLREYLGV